MGAQGEWEEVAEEPEEEYEEPAPEEAPEAEVEYAEEEPPPSREPTRAVARPDKSVLAMLSGLGFFVAVLLLIFGVWNLSASVPAGAPAFTALVIVGLVLAIAIPYLWMLDDLRVRPRRLRRTHARFMAGPLIGILAIVLFALFSLANQDWILVILAVAVVAITQASVALFLYSMLWEE
ncbi:MAG: hypothetical protein E6K10_03040 [Methanobacteriota archaeon]|nr:MAG: hypothetical protein E6K10_03040 [Euryarchaeota archaeon]